MATKTTAPARTPQAKEKAFKDLASTRTQKVLSSIQTLAHCSSKATYSYTPEQATAIVAAIQAELDRLKAAFDKGGVKKAGGFTV